MSSKNFIVLVVITFLPVNSGLKLTENENKIRRETCGKGLNYNGYGRKVLNGVKAEINTAPWNVAIEIVNDEENGLCTGTLISKRHVITARHCFAYLTDEGYVWNTNNQLIFGCQNDETDIAIDRNFNNTFKIHVGTDCGYRNNCLLMGNKTIGISKMIFPKVCDDKQLDFDDFAILELSENLKFSKTVRSVCIPYNDSNLFVGDNRMKLFGFGVNPHDGNNSAGQLRYETVKAEKCFKSTKKAFCTRSLSKNQLACMGDSGGGVVQLIDGLVTVVGVIYQGVTCDISTEDEKDYVSSVAFYSNDICKYTGICLGKETMKNKIKLTSKHHSTIRTTTSIILIFVFLMK